MSYAVGIDVGGTFTDLVLSEDGGGLRLHKTPTTPADPSIGVLQGLSDLADQLGLDRAAFLGQVGLIVHGTTVTTNAILTDRGSRTGLLTTEGFRDILEMRRGVRSRKHLYDNKYVAPRPLVPRYLRLPVTERVDVRGAVRTPLDRASVERALDLLAAEKVEAVAVCLMHGYANDAHEREVAAMVRERLPDAYLAVSHEILPQVRLNSRVSTTVMSAYVGPVLDRYVRRLVDALAEASFAGTLLIMQSNGGVATPEIVARNPATTVLSGPAGGPAAGLAHSRPCGSDDCVIVDMGGTSFDASIVKNGEVETTREGEINRHTIALPMIDVHTIGAGGGSIGRLDEGGLLHMGPQSAGADPGPACYGRGGTLPTCTDADLVLGHLDPEWFLGGRMRLDVDAARAAIEEHVAGPLGLDVTRAAAAMVEVIDLAMAAGTKDVCLRRGYDPRELPLVVAGGAGAVHAGAIADELGMTRVIVPRMSSVLCALGMLLADLRHDYTRAFSRPWVALDPAEVRSVIDAMVAEGWEALEREGVAEADRDVVAAADLRYVGQHHEVSVSFPLADLDDLSRVEAAFHRRHEELYGFASQGKPMEVIGLHATVLGRRAPLALAVPEAGAGEAPRRAPRRMWLRETATMVEVEVLDGDRMTAGQGAVGPLLVDTATTTIVVPTGFSVALDPSGSFVMTRGAT